jgi:hypothetical protein
LNRDGIGHVIVNRGGSVDSAVNTVGPIQAQLLAVQAQAQSHVTASSSSSQLNQSSGNNLISDVNGLEDITNKIVITIMDYIKPILEPIQVSYSNEILVNQIYGISIMLFVLSILVIVLLIFFMLNILLFIYSDRIMNYFSNQFIR